MIINWLAAVGTACTHCGAAVGQPCVDEYGSPLTWAPCHVSRALIMHKR